MKLSEVRKMYNVDDYRAALQIDQHRLDDMLMQQPVIQQTISEMAAEVVSMRDAAKERLVRVDAQVAKVLRNRIMIEEGKVSETRVDKEVPLTREHKEAHHVYNELCALAAQWDALKDTVRNRSFVIRDLVSLYTANFFTDTSFRSPTNPSAVRDLEYNTARAALAEGRRARRTLAGVPEDVELQAKVDETLGEDAELGEADETPSRPESVAKRSARSTTRKNAKKAATEGVDSSEKGGDTTQQDTDTADTAPKKKVRAGSRAAALRERVRSRSGERVLNAEFADEETGRSARPMSADAGADTETDATSEEVAGQAATASELDTAPEVDSAPDSASTDAGNTATEGETPPRRRRRYARARAAS